MHTVISAFIRTSVISFTLLVQLLPAGWPGAGSARGRRGRVGPVRPGRARPVRLHVEFADTREPCGGQNGRFLSGGETDPDAVRHILVCRRLPVILLHELAHAWERTATSDETRAEFIDFWGLERWNDIADDWSDRGAEMAAESIAYALTIDEPTTNPVMVRYACGFEILTGSLLFPGGTESCPANDLV